MIGGLLKSSSKLALMAAAGILVGGVGMGTAKAADLGGDCCADLEERVAELEATTVRKGNRKVSLTLTGQIDKEIMYYRDDVRSKTFAGVDNINSSTRFFFTGNAKVSSSVTAGFEMMIEWAGQTRSDLINQLGPTLQSNWGPNLSNAEISRDGALAVRTANWWLEDKVLGRVTVGRVNIQGPASTIDVSGGDLAIAAWSNPFLQGGGFWLQRKDTTQLSTTSFSTIAPWCYGCSREEGIRWDSVSIGGLLLGAFWGQQDRFTVQARYAAEFAGFQVAAGAGYQHDNQLGFEDPGAAAGKRTDTEQQGYALSAKHIASGLFAQGQYGITHFNMVGNVPASVSGKTDGTSYHIQGGWAKNAFGPGMTTVYGEYGHGQGYASAPTNPTAQISGAAPTNGNFTGLCGVGGGCNITSDSFNYYGAGVTQKIDAAAMTLYLTWRHFDPKMTTTSGAIPLSSFDTVIGGARILF